MSSDRSRLASFRSHSWRWVLYVVLALFGGSLTFVGARAQQKATEEATFRKLIDDYCAAWSSGNADNAAKYYAQEEGVVFYDVAPFSYQSWKQYRIGVQKNLFDNLKITDIQFRDISALGGLQIMLDVVGRLWSLA